MSLKRKIAIAISFAILILVGSILFKSAPSNKPMTLSDFFHEGNYESKVDGSEATLILKKTSENKALFTIYSEVRMNEQEGSVHTCSIEGSMDLTGNEGLWSSPENLCSLKFSFAKDQVSINSLPGEEHNQCRMTFCGRNASFEGDYKKAEKKISDIELKDGSILFATDQRNVTHKTIVTGEQTKQVLIAKNEVIVKAEDEDGFLHTFSAIKSSQRIRPFVLSGTDGDSSIVKVLVWDPQSGEIHHLISILDAKVSNAMDNKERLVVTLSDIEDSPNTKSYTLSSGQTDPKCTDKIIFGFDNFPELSLSCN